MSWDSMRTRLLAQIFLFEAWPSRLSSFCLLIWNDGVAEVGNLGKVKFCQLFGSTFVEKTTMHWETVYLAESYRFDRRRTFRL